MTDLPTPAQLLGRPDQPVYDDRAHDLIKGKRVLVTGAGGSIGSELCRQVHRLGPSKLYMLDHDETLLQAVQFDIEGNGLLDTDQLILADIRESASVFTSIRDAAPDIVFHAAAHKHLTLLERNPNEAVRTNALGTRNVLRAAHEANVGCFVNISTDKAADPTSVLGASKRIAEMLVRSYSATGMNVASVRFGNVLGSRGSFLPILERQIARGDAITITDKNVERYFMTIPEAAGLVIEAATMAKDGETFVLEMGEQVKIVELVDRYVELSGCKPPKLVYTGLRPGEKLAEVPFSRDEDLKKTVQNRVWLTSPPILPDSFLADFQLLEDSAIHNNRELTIKQLQALVEGYVRADQHPGRVVLLPTQTDVSHAAREKMESAGRAGRASGRKR